LVLISYNWPVVGEQSKLSDIVDGLHLDTASALQVNTDLFVRRLCHSPVQAELTLAGTSALARLESARSATSSDLARAEQITLQAMGATLAAIEERGLMERRPDPSDGRRVTMSVAAAGQQALRNKLIAPIEQLANALAGGFTQAAGGTMRTAASPIERLGERL